MWCHKLYFFNNVRTLCCVLFFYSSRPPRSLDQTIIRAIKQWGLWDATTATTTRTSKKRSVKQQLCTFITLFCTFFCRHCTTTTGKGLISRFMEDVTSDSLACVAGAKRGIPEEVRLRERFPSDQDFHVISEVNRKVWEAAILISHGEQKLRRVKTARDDGEGRGDGRGWGRVT